MNDSRHISLDSRRPPRRPANCFVIYRSPSSRLEVALYQRRREYAVVRQGVLEGEVDLDSVLYQDALERRIDSCIDYICEAVNLRVEAETKTLAWATTAAAVAHLTAVAELGEIADQSVDTLVIYLARYGLWAQGPDGLSYQGLPEDAPDHGEF